MPVFWKEKYWLSWSLPLLVHETNLTPSGKCQGCQGVKTIQRRVKDTAMLPLPEILIACLCVLVFFKHLLKADMTRMLFSPYPPIYPNILLAFQFFFLKSNHWHSFRWKVRNILKSAVSFISSCTVWIPVGRADEKHRENWQGVYKPNVMKDICAYYITWDDLGCPLYCFSSSLLPPLF